MEIDSSEERKNIQFRNLSTQSGSFEEQSTEEPVNPGNIKRRKHSFVWQYFRPLGSSSGGSLECIICASSVSKQTSNLARHLFAAHDISRQSRQEKGECEEFVPKSALGRPSRSFIWKYCTKEDCRYARCHLCNKLLYFGGGNTANITKHLKRKHLKVISNQELGPSNDMDDSEEFVTEVSNQMDSTINSCDEDLIKVKRENNSDMSHLRKERKGSSYVWNYCDKLSRHTIRCKLCKKVMSFHGTANVITHLQRRHNIVGRVENEATILNVTDEESGTVEVKDEPNQIVRRRRRSAAATSIVWKYCTRLGQDVVRCSFCKKNLSFQGTSNLQRHLHRMHGIVTQGRGFGELGQGSTEVDDNFIWEHCENTEDGKIKCNMCNSTFDEKSFEEIRKHLTVTHAILSSPPAKRQRRRRRNPEPEETGDETDEYDCDNDDDNWQEVNEEFTIEYDDEGIKKDQQTFEDIIEEDHVGQVNGDEDPFDPNLMHNYPIARPLSGASSRDITPDRTFKISIDSNRLRKLNEERLRMETEYFREKAGYYRMQKYFTALQAKKARLELDRLQNTELNGSAYQGNIDSSDTNAATTIFNNQKN